MHKSDRLLDALFLNVSFVGSAPLARELGDTRARVITTQVVPYPGNTELPLVRDFHADMERIDPEDRVGRDAPHGLMEGASTPSTGGEASRTRAGWRGGRVAPPSRAGTDSFGALEGYIAARIFTRAMERIGGVPSREGVINALEGLGDFDIGIGVGLRLTADDHQACHRVWPTLLRKGRFVPVGWSEMGRLLASQEAR